MTCIDRKRKAALVLDDYHSSSEEKKAAKLILATKSCDFCSNPLVRELSIDDLLCEDKKNAHGEVLAPTSSESCSQ